MKGKKKREKDPLQSHFLDNEYKEMKPKPNVMETTSFSCRSRAHQSNINPREREREGEGGREGGREDSYKHTEDKIKYLKKNDHREPQINYNVFTERKKKTHRAQIRYSSLGPDNEGEPIHENRGEGWGGGGGRGSSCLFHCCCCFPFCYNTLYR